MKFHVGQTLMVVGKNGLWHHFEVPSRVIVECVEKGDCFVREAVGDIPLRQYVSNCDLTAVKFAVVV